MYPVSVDIPVPARLEGDEAAEQRQRIDALRATMRGRGLSVLAVTSPENIYYLTGLDHLGYFAFTMLLLPLDGHPVLVTREMELPTVRAQVPDCLPRTFGDGADAAEVAAGALRELTRRGGAIGVEAQSMFFPPDVYLRLRDAVPGRGWVDCTGTLAAQRAVKSESELRHVRAAAAVSDTGMLAGLRSAAGAAGAGGAVNEARVAASIHHAMFTAGGTQPGFSPLIRPTSMLAYEHVTWGGRDLAPGQGLFIELSGCVRRYHAPQSRTVYIGSPPDGAEDASAAALAGLVAARDALRPGARAGDVYAAWQRAVAADRANPAPLRHHCGYQVGIGFPPSWVGGGQVVGLRADSDAEIGAGMVFHLMSWVSGPPGHVVSDTAVVTGAGAVLLTTTPRALTVLRPDPENGRSEDADQQHDVHPGRGAVPL